MQNVQSERIRCCVLADLPATADLPAWLQSLHCSEQKEPHREQPKYLDVPDLWLDLRRGRGGSGARNSARHALGRC